MASADPAYPTAANPGRRTRTGVQPVVRWAVLTLLVVCTLAGCTTATGASSAPAVAASGTSSGLSLSQKLTTIQVCAQAAGDLRTVAATAAKAATGTATQADLSAKLAPVEANITSLAQQNASLPIGRSLQAMSTAITAVTGAASASPSAVTTAAQNLVTAAKDVVNACIAVKS